MQPLTKLDELIDDLHAELHRGDSAIGLQVNEVLMGLMEARIMLEKAYMKNPKQRELPLDSHHP